MNSQDYHDLVAAYTLGALEPDEQAVLEAQIAADADLQAEVESYKAIVAELALASQPVAPPPLLKSRLLARVAGDSSSSTQPEPVGPQLSARAPLALPARRRWPWAQLAAAIIAMLLIGGLGVGWLNAVGQLEASRSEQNQLVGQLRDAQRNVEQLRQNQEQLQTQLDAALRNQEQLVADLNQSRAQVTQLRQQVATEERLVAFLGNANLAVRGLTATSEAPDASGAMYMQPGVRDAVVFVSGLPPLPQGQTYQFWLAQNANPVQFNAGVIQRADDGTARLVLQAPLPVDRFQQVMITVEQSEQRTFFPSDTTVLFGAL